MEFEATPLESRGPLYKVIRIEKETLVSATSRIQKDVEKETAWGQLGFTSHFPEIRQARKLVLFDRLRLPLSPKRTVYERSTT